MSGIGRNRQLPFAIALAMFAGITACTLRVGDPPVASDDVAATTEASVEAASAPASKESATATAARDGATPTSETTQEASSDATPEVRASEPVSTELGEWIRVGSMANEHASHTATLLHDGTVLVVGGPAVGAELYDPGSRTFSSVDNPQCAHGHSATATLLDDGRVLVVGGESDHRCADLYDPDTQSFARTGDPVADLWVHTATLLPDGMVLLAGGFERQADRWVTTAAAELFDPRTGMFAVTGSMPTAQEGHAAVLLRSGLVLVVGGMTSGISADGVGLWNNCHFAAALYDPRAGAFTSITAARKNQCSLAATPLEDGDVLVTSSSDFSERYDALTGVFQPSGVLRQSRFAHTVTVLGAGKLLVAGGQTGQTMLRSTELFDPEAEAFTVIAEMNDRRGYHQATLLSDGSILVTGGWDGVRPLRSAELFVPAGVVLDRE